MGKVIVIKGADFSSVAVERIEYSDNERTAVVSISQNNKYWANLNPPTERNLTGYGSIVVDISSLVGEKLVVSCAAGSGNTSFILRIDNAQNNMLYRVAGQDSTIVKAEVTIPVGSKYLYINNYFPWDNDPVAYVYDVV